MIREGALGDAEAIFAVHVSPSLSSNPDNQPVNTNNPIELKVVNF